MIFLLLCKFNMVKGNIWVNKWVDYIICYQLKIIPVFSYIYLFILTGKSVIYFLVLFSSIIMITLIMNGVWATFGRWKRVPYSLVAVEGRCETCRGSQASPCEFLTRNYKKLKSMDSACQGFLSFTETSLLAIADSLILWSHPESSLRPWNCLFFMSL